ncbi:hypothetical protein Ahy_A09g045483 [Arachis hypogaea]|uniref:Uncharacterized protein n=1 Tax=Arachis hypogaea TaxID=3818 RepID=A0A445BME7_ARAHY|nr:hypothetical protein Ahy_A09g045483 [Arachis hypogaea]
MPKNVLDFNIISSIPNAGVSEAVGGFFGAATGIIGNTVDNVTSVFSQQISLKLINATKTDGVFISFSLSFL